MNKPIRRACVIGAGVMGQGIAAHFANAGIEVLLLDIVPPDLKDADKAPKAARNAFAAGGLDKALKARPAAFFHKQNARLVSVGNTEDDLAKVSTCDLVIEAVLERIDVKQALLEKLEALVPPHAIVASNTSGLRIVDMLKGRSDAFKKRFLVMHFFNPVRYMKLLELVWGPDTDPAVVAHVKKFGEDVLGKGVVFGKDTPNFVGNRIGVHAMMSTIHQMLEDGLTPEDVDNITGTPMGHPKSASFRTADLVGLDTFAHVSDNCFKALENDEDRKIFELPAFIRTMVEKKLLGNKTKGGFYKKGADKSISTFDPKALDYRPKGGDDAIKNATKAIAKEEDVRKRVKKLVADEGKAGAFAWKVLSKSLAYSARRIGEITDDVTAIDDAMKWGYNWELGPFEVWDALGFEAVYDRMVKDGVLPPQERAAYVEGAKLNEAGRKRVSQLMLGRFFKDPAQLDAVPLSVRGKLERIAAPLAKTENTGFSLADTMAGAVELIESARAHGSATLTDYIRQGGLFIDQQYSPEAITMARHLQSTGPLDLTKRVRQYASDASFAEGGASMFGDTPTPAKSFMDAFGGEVADLPIEAAAKVAPPPAPPKPQVVTSPAGKEAVDHLTRGRAMTREKYEVADVVQQLRQEPVQLFNQLTYAKDSGVELLRSVAKHAPGEGKADLESAPRRGAKLRILQPWPGLVPHHTPMTRGCFAPRWLGFNASGVTAG